MTADDPDFLTRLYDLRSQCAAAHAAACDCKLYRVAVDIATARENLSEAITSIERNHDEPATESTGGNHGGAARPHP